MCTYSMIHDFAAKHWQPDQWTRPMVDDYEELIRRLKRIDDAIGLPDCDPNKGEFLDAIKKRLDAIEKKVGL